MQITSQNHPCIPPPCWMKITVFDYDAWTVKKKKQTSPRVMCQDMLGQGGDSGYYAQPFLLFIDKITLTTVRLLAIFLLNQNG